MSASKGKQLHFSVPASDRLDACMCYGSKVVACLAILSAGNCQSFETELLLSAVIIKSCGKKFYQYNFRLFLATVLVSAKQPSRLQPVLVPWRLKLSNWQLN